MSEVLQFIEATFKPLVLVFVIANMFTLGIQARMGDVIAAFKNKTAMGLILVWGFVIGPVLAYLITLVIPLAEPYVLVLLISSVAPMAPFFPIAVEKARGDVMFANAFVPVVIVGTVILMPLITPMLIKGVEVTAADLAARLFVTLLLPKAIGMAVRHYADTLATRIFPAVNVLTKIITLIALIECVVIYGPPLLETLGSFAMLSATIFSVVMGLVSYRFGFGLKQDQRSVMSLGMLQRNMGGILVVLFAIPDLEPIVLTFTIMWGVWTVILSAIAARIFAKHAGEPTAGNAT